MERDGLITVGYVPSHLTHCLYEENSQVSSLLHVFFMAFIFSFCSSEEKDGETKDEKGE